MKNSTSLKNQRYNPRAKTLQIDFYIGNTYTYHDVPFLVWLKFVNSEYPASFFYKFIYNKYKCTYCDCYGVLRQRLFFDSVVE